jgi:hypothetical protein
MRERGTTWSKPAARARVRHLGLHVGEEAEATHGV